MVEMGREGTGIFSVCVRACGCPVLRAFCEGKTALGHPLLVGLAEFS